jgi:uncharacterized protein
MDVTPLVSSGASIIQSYAEGKFRVSGQVYEGAVLVFPDHVENWSASEPLTPEFFQPLLEKSREIDVVLLGCGRAVAPEIFALRRDLKARGLHVEFMDTGAACRTFNVLLTEGRRVAAALLPV